MSFREPMLHSVVHMNFIAFLSRWAGIGCMLRKKGSDRGIWQGG
jgi:hypothetical protein